MNLCIDRGNTMTKIGIFDQNGIMVFNHSYNDFSIKELTILFADHFIDNCIISSVIGTDLSVMEWMQSKVKKCIFLDHTTPIPIENKYKTPKTLGNDRLAAVIGANFLKPNTNILVVDAGSAITYDFINKNNQYLGGSIAPGLNMRLKALHEFTKKLPLVEAHEPSAIEILGHTTEEAILSGVINGIIFEMEGYFDHIQKKYSDVSFFLTGGNFYYFHNRLKMTNFAEIFLVLIGLNRILEYNVQN